MTISEILRELEPYTGRFPMEAMRAAIEQREAITPELLRVLESVAAAPVEWAARKDNMLPMFALFLLAQFREKAAYRPLVRIVSAPGETPFDLFGDTITEALSRILASVYDGDPAPLHGLIESEQINEYVRSGALEAFLVLENEAQVSRESVLEYFTSLFHGRLQRVPSYAWSSLVCAAADLPAPELIDDIRQAYAEGLVDTMVARLDGLERDLKSPPRRDREHFITDAIDEMECWASFHQDDSQPGKLPKLKTPVPPPRDSDFAPDDIAPNDFAPDDFAPLPVVREPKIGRNEACPCGSGKKYKKCCGK